MTGSLCTTSPSSTWPDPAVSVSSSGGRRVHLYRFGDIADLQYHIDARRFVDSEDHVALHKAFESLRFNHNLIVPDGRLGM